jgi:hypothetical protein
MRGFGRRRLLSWLGWPAAYRFYLHEVCFPFPATQDFASLPGNERPASEAKAQPDHELPTVSDSPTPGLRTGRPPIWLAAVEDTHPTAPRNGVIALSVTTGTAIEFKEIRLKRLKSRR